MRPEEIGSGHGVAQLRPTMRIPLGELDERDLAPLGIDDLHHRTEGHPLFVSLAVATDEAGRRVRSEWVAARCRAEGDLACRLLSAACLLEESFSASRLAGVLDMDTAMSRKSSTASVFAGVLSLDDGRFRFRARIDARVPGRQPLARLAHPAREPHRARRATRPEREADGERHEASAASHDGRASAETARSRPRVEPGLAS